MKIHTIETMVEADARELRESNTLAQNFASMLNRCFRSTESFYDDYETDANEVSDSEESEE